jgi:hypothetical protein
MSVRRKFANSRKKTKHDCSLRQVGIALFMTQIAQLPRTEEALDVNSVKSGAWERVGSGVLFPELDFSA